jgi:hypothetical protein
MLYLERNCIQVGVQLNSSSLSALVTLLMLKREGIGSTLCDSDLTLRKGKQLTGSTLLKASEDVLEGTSCRVNSGLRSCAGKNELLVVEVVCVVSAKDR